MTTSNRSDSPIIQSPIIDSPISLANPAEYQDFNPACAAGMPAGNRMFYFKFVFILFAVLGTLMFGLFKLCEHLGVF